MGAVIIKGKVGKGIHKHLAGRCVFRQVSCRKQSFRMQVEDIKMISVRGTLSEYQRRVLESHCSWKTNHSKSISESGSEVYFSFFNSFFLYFKVGDSETRKGLG